MLKVNNIHTYYGAIHALKGISLEVNDGEIVCLIGSNGAGKSTLVNTIAGLLKTSEGEILFNDEKINNISSFNIVKKKISLSPEGREVFPQLTVEENLIIGSYVIKNKEEVQKNLDFTYHMFPRLAERKVQYAGTLSGGEQQMLAIGRALMSSPKLLILDEPSLGIAPNLTVEIFKMIKKISQEGITILLIEQNANMALKISDRAYVLENGVISLEGDAEEIANNSEVKKIYLGL
ncbi:ABC transporter ATP-binding protein [Tuanshanicoccus lijuaniae]|uniref:ABC transporter ATP-binding protein n=1 Tax=Aerococcaceae bacterium zg-1292 TaxID=2774330 RepID=UPI001BD82EFA|nr:ABC transporter ATP-binding protein [Aerococcaceae bacterium zg-BR22]MBS4455511.1 ABC transporter ATP-binding protein [Aerococcaceae bacterium zg-A91]MBS4457130.1 ABC transporter ATP-binding protein [Aerococcaceae bacterium zg-BR33]